MKEAIWILGLVVAGMATLCSACDVHNEDAADRSSHRTVLRYSTAIMQEDGIYASFEPVSVFREDNGYRMLLRPRSPGYRHVIGFIKGEEPIEEAVRVDDLVEGEASYFPYSYARAYGRDYLLMAPREPSEPGGLKIAEIALDNGKLSEVPDPPVSLYSPIPASGRLLVEEISETAEKRVFEYRSGEWREIAAINLEAVKGLGLAGSSLSFKWCEGELLGGLEVRPGQPRGYEQRVVLVQLDGTVEAQAVLELKEDGKLLGVAISDGVLYVLVKNADDVELRDGDGKIQVVSCGEHAVDGSAVAGAGFVGGSKPLQIWASYPDKGSTLAIVQLPGALE